MPEIIEAKCEHCGGAVIASGPDGLSVKDAALRHLAKKHPKVAKK